MSVDLQSFILKHRSFVRKLTTFEAPDSVGDALPSMSVITLVKSSCTKLAIK